MTLTTICFVPMN